ncbi:MerR family transcriptional regulator [Streptomyces sp. A1136]|uniref:MerR family transcriptional regulator n=1 Tax=Streptomyces sp. A1136 TaxID=2563102 RepID=UPI00109E4552|nr:MerR family transcriptional regulator [Streptomyces sp. A1136]THA51365.1 MerR family transcriptional regulator [Streptomyces sp. A1136]
MNGTTSPHSIGSLSTRTGVPVRTIRFYSDSGLLPPTHRTSAGYRRYDDAALLRLRTICVLRELDVDLATIRHVLGGGLSVAEVAAAHADATEVQIRVLRLRRSVLRHLARRGSSPEEISFMHRLTSLTTGERHRLISDFIEDLTARTSSPGPAAAALRTAVPELPDDPSDEQLAAWVELAELMGDDGFRARMAEVAPAPADEDVLPGVPAETAAELIAFAGQAAGAAMEAGADPEGEDASVVADGVVAHFATVLGRPAGPELGEWMASRFEAGHDPLTERYFRLVWTVNDWHVVPGHLPFQPWLVKALRHPRPNDQARPPRNDR